jgi:RNA recognition motif-containing protein
MAKRLFVGGLPYSATDQELSELFSQIGEVASATVITDKYSGQGKGFGFVEYKNDEDADKAIKELTGKDFGGRKIIVNEARPREERSSAGFDRRGGDSRGSRRW